MVRSQCSSHSIFNWPFTPAESLPNARSDRASPPPLGCRSTCQYACPAAWNSPESPKVRSWNVCACRSLSLLSPSSAPCYVRTHSATALGKGARGQMGATSHGLQPRETATVGTIAMLTIGEAEPLTAMDQWPHSRPAPITLPWYQNQVRVPQEKKTIHQHPWWGQM